ncbi:MAG: hypothetical protein COS68_06650 [Elusimicrobia bacterium CG06_land_8_20_14_3_00_38_11]|nr:MAG: hypothetical protein COS68_06650 [Elusimicrobia bacterium CG06_land_8_20_14_3_00_38_11]
MKNTRKILLTVITIFLFFYIYGYCEGKTLTLEECLSTADKNNPEIISQQYKIKEMNSKYHQEISNILPQIDANMSYLKYDWQLPSKKALFGQSLDDYYAELSLKQILFGGGKNIAKIKSSRATLDAETQKYEQLKRTVHLSVKKAYYELLRALFALKTQEKLIDKLKEQYNIAQLLYNSGKTTNLDVLKIQTQLASAEDITDNLKNLVYTKSLLLGYAMGVNEQVNILFDLPGINENIKINTLCVNDEFENNPELKYIDNLVNKAKHDISAEVGEIYPTVFIRANQFWEDKTFFPGNQNWYAGVGLSMPLFHSGAIISKINQAKYKKSQVIETQKQVKLNLTVRFQSAQATVIDKLNRLKTTKKVLDLSKETLIAAELKYNAGKITATELLDSQTVWLNSELNYINNIIDCKISLAEIEYICPEAISSEVNK